jgi:hypothetical protein
LSLNDDWHQLCSSSTSGNSELASKSTAKIDMLSLYVYVFGEIICTHRISVYATQYTTMFAVVCGIEGAVTLLHYKLCRYWPNLTCRLWPETLKALHPFLKSWTRLVQLSSMPSLHHGGGGADTKLWTFTNNFNMKDLSRDDDFLR